MSIDDEKPREPQIVTDNANESQKVLRNFILENLDKPRCANMLLFIGCLTDNVDDVTRALDNGADVDHEMTAQEKRILTVAGFNLD